MLVVALATSTNNNVLAMSNLRACHIGHPKKTPSAIWGRMQRYLNPQPTDRNGSVVQTINTVTTHAETHTYG